MSEPKPSTTLSLPAAAKPPKPLSRAERQRLQLRADIIEAAFTEFSEKGYHQTAIADIAKRLGIGHGTFYRYFKNKRDILEHVIDDVAKRVSDALADENAPSAATSLENYREQTQRIGKLLTRIVAENPRVTRLLLLEATSIDPEMTQRIMGFLSWGTRLIAAYMENGVKAGFFRADLDVEATGHAVMGLILTSALSVLTYPDDKQTQKRIADAVLRMLVDGIANRA